MSVNRTVIFIRKSHHTRREWVSSADAQIFPVVWIPSIPAEMTGIFMYKGMPLTPQNRSFIAIDLGPPSLHAREYRMKRHSLGETVGVRL